MGRLLKINKINNLPPMQNARGGAAKVVRMKQKKK